MTPAKGGDNHLGKGRSRLGGGGVPQQQLVAPCRWGGWPHVNALGRALGMMPGTTSTADPSSAVSSAVPAWSHMIHTDVQLSHESCCRREAQSLRQGHEADVAWGVSRAAEQMHDMQWAGCDHGSSDNWSTICMTCNGQDAITGPASMVHNMPVPAGPALVFGDLSFDFPRTADRSTARLPHSDSQGLHDEVWVQV